MIVSFRVGSLVSGYRHNREESHAEALHNSGLPEELQRLTSRGLKTASPFHDRTADNDLHQISFMRGDDSLQVIPYPLFHLRHSSLQDSFTP